MNLDDINAPTGSSADDIRHAGLWNIGVALERLRTEMETSRTTGPDLPSVLREQLTKPCHDFLYISGAFRRLYPVGRSVGLLG